MLNKKQSQKLIRKTMFYRLRPFAAAFVAVLLLLYPVPGQSAEKKTTELPKTTTPVPAPAPSVPAAVPVADVATKATEVANLLQTMTQKLASSPQVEVIRELLSDISRQIDEDLVVTMDVLHRQSSLSTLQAQQQKWQQMQLKAAGWLAVLTKRSNTLQDALDRLTGLQKTWETTLKASQTAKAPGPILQQVAQTLAAIKAAQIPLQKQLTSVLDLQSSVSDEVAKCGKALAVIDQAQQTAMAGTMVRDSLPVWSPELWADALPAMPERVRSIAVSNWMEISNYIKDPSRHMPLHAGLFLALTLFFLAARNQIRRWETVSSALRVFDHPFVAALAIAMLVATSPLWSVSITLKAMIGVLSIAPVIILIRPLVRAKMVPGLYVMGLLFVIDTLRQIFADEALIRQVFLMFESLAGIAVVIWFLKNVKTVYGEEAGSSRLRALQNGAGFVLLVLAAGLAAAVTGYVRLARLLTPGILVAGVLAMALYVVVRVVNGVAAFAFRIWPLRTLRMVGHYHEMLERRINRVFIWAAIISLVVRYLHYMGLLDPTLSFGRAILTAKFERGAFSISPGGVLEFFITVWAAYLLSAFIRFVLQEDVYPRIGIATGKSYAVSSLLHYFILALGFTVAIAALGVNLTKLTVLTGAFGVGIGFGLQGVVNNFVSGLILLFERPIHVGDTVEVGDLLGKVRRIGIRASTVHTRQGADIIVPNSQLVTEKVTNWTLSDQLRRIDLPVGVNYSSAPGEVIKVLEAVALANKNVLKNPEPKCLFVGFGDSSINFELRAWTDQFDDWPQVRSELASAIYDAVYAAGMTFPFPQREVRLLRDPDTGDPMTGLNQDSKP